MSCSREHGNEILDSIKCSYLSTSSGNVSFWKGVCCILYFVCSVVQIILLLSRGNIANCDLIKSGCSKLT